MKCIFFTFFFLGLCLEATAFEAPETCPSKPADKDSAVALAGKWFNEGQKLVKSQDYADAVDAFMCSLEMVEHEATFFNAGKAAILAEKYDVAIELGNGMLGIAKNEQTKMEAEELVAKARKAMTEHASEAEPVVESQISDPRPGSQMQVNDEDTTKQSGVDKGRSFLWITGLTSTLAGGASLIIGGVLQGLAGSGKKTTGETDDYAEYVDAKNNIDTFQTGATVSLVLGGAFVAAGVTMLLIDKKKNREKQSVSFALTGNGFLLGGTF